MNLKIDPRTILPSDNQLNKGDAKKDKELQALRRSCREFEAIYVNEMYKSMRKTVPESGLFEKKGRSEERRVGKECLRTCRSRGSPSH